MTEQIVPEKYCPRCETTKPASDFHTVKTRKDGLDSYCKPCAHRKRQAWRKTERGQAHERAPHTRNKNKERLKRYNKRHALRLRCRGKGIDVEQHSKLMTQQGSKCAICGGNNKGRTLAIDHCHTSGEVRGLLCFDCNVGLGHFKDNPDLLATARNYLLTHAA